MRAARYSATVEGRMPLPTEGGVQRGHSWRRHAGVSQTVPLRRWLAGQRMPRGWQPRAWTAHRQRPRWWLCPGHLSKLLLG